MAAMLRAPFRIAALSHSKDLLSITWQDGAKSKFPNIWLRGSVRDPRFFAQGSLQYNQKAFANFISKESPIVGVKNDTGSEDVDVEWEDHRSSFNASWLRAQDMKNNELLRKEPEFTLWDATFKFPTYNYSERMTKLKHWLNDLTRYGVAFFEGVPPSQEGLDGILHCVGQAKQRYHPTNTVEIWTDQRNQAIIDEYTYGMETNPFHIDTSYYDAPSRLSCLVTTRYTAPIQDTFNYWVDNLTVIEQLRLDDPEAYELLTTIPTRYARRRMDVQEACDPAMFYIYHWDTAIEKKLISYDRAEKRHLTAYVSNFQAGMELSRVLKDPSMMKNYYEAYLLFQSKLNDPENHQTFLLKEGNAAIFNNHRVSHARGDIHPSTDRRLLLGFIGGDTWNTRWRVLNGEKSGLEEKWLYGCSNEQLEILAIRKEQ